MKKLFFILPISIVTLLTVSCKKDSADGRTGTISANIAGIKKTFNVSAKASMPSVYNGNGSYGIRIFGYEKGTTVSGTYLQLEIVSSTAITSGTFTENTANNPLVQIDYLDDVSGPIFIVQAIVQNYSNHHSTTNPVTVTITGISATSVTGTFQGELEAIGWGTTQITNGVFNVNF